MTLVEELHALQDRLTDLPKYEKLVLDLAAMLAEELVEIRTGSLPGRVTRMALDDYLERIPDRFEFVDGRPRAKYWNARVEIPGFLAVWHGLHSRYWSAFTNQVPCAAGSRGCGKVGILLLDFHFSTALG
jgi:hypothetical protein